MTAPVTDTVIRQTLTRQESAPPEGRRHVILVDATAAMRGDRSVFARAYALALAKKHALSGDEVAIRFFDAQLYEPIDAGDRLPVAEVIGFRGEDGRNVARVLRRLADEIEATQRRRPRRVIVHFVTHGATQAPRDLVTRILHSAELSVVLVSPGGTADAGFVDLVTSCRIVTSADTADPARQASRARELLLEHPP